MSSLDYLDLCRLCLVKDRASVPIFEGEGDVRQIFLKIAACLPVKVVRGDKLPKKICDDCVYKVEQFYQFWNTTANVEKQLLQWLGDVGMEDKQAYVSGVLNPDQSVEGRLNANVIQQTDEHQNNMGMNMMDTMNLDMPMMMQTEQSQMTTMNSNDTNVQTIQAVPGTSVRPPQQERRKDDEDESSEDEDNSDDECDADEGLSVKEETEETANRTIEPTFVNVSLPCDEAGPSGLQQQKINEMSDMVMAQSTDGDPKSGYSKLNQEFNDEICTNPIHPVTSKFLHAAMIIKNEGEMSECDYCGILFRNRADLQEHNKLHQTQIFDFNFSDYIEELPIDAEDEMVNEHPIESANNEEEPFEIHSEKVLILEDFESHKEVEQIENQQDKSVEVNCESEKSDKCSNKVDIRESRNRVTIYASVCEICSRKFTTEMDLIRHVKKLHNKHPIIGTFYNCHLCGEIFDNESQLIVHSKLHSIQPLQLHEYENRKNIQRNLVRNSDQLQNQKNSKFCRNENDSEKVSNSRGKMKYNKNDTSKNMVQCAHCGLMYPKKISLILHLRSHLVTTRKKIEKLKMQDEYRNNVSKSRKLSISEETTEYSMSPKDIMKYVKMDSDKFYPCSLCKYRCKQKGNLKSHIIRRHASIAFFHCEICNRNFKMKYDLTFHEQHIHSIFTCKDCGIKFNSKVDMIYHKRIHLKKTFQCNVCEYSSNQKGNLKMHINNRHEKKF